MWDTPEPRDRQFNRFARREVTKATRAAEYWSSEADEYALPGMANVSGTSGFKSARQMAGSHTDRDQRDRDRNRMSQPVNVKREVKPPPVLLKSNHHFPELPKFSFNAPETEKKDPTLGSWTSASSSSLAMMKNLGLPGEGEGSTGSLSPRFSAGGSSPVLGSPRGGGGFGAAIALPSPGGSLGLGGFQAKAAGGLAALKGLGLPDAGATVNGVGGSGGAGAKLAQGTKRLGMGRPAAWGSGNAKKARTDK